MKKTLTIFGLLLTTLTFGQTTQMEWNYANGGYIELLKLGIDSKEGYVIRQTGITLAPAQGLFMSKAPYYVLMLERTKDKSVAAIMIAENGEKPVLTIMDPKTETTKQYVAASSAPVGTYFDYRAAVAELLQRQFWPEYYIQ